MEYCPAAAAAAAGTMTLAGVLSPPISAVDQ